MRFFRPRIDRLESRQLMASDVGTWLLPADLAATDAIASSDVLATSSSTSDSSSPEVPSTELFRSGNPILDYGLSSVVVRSGSTIVVADHTSSLFMVIAQTDTDSPRITHRLKLNLGVQDVKIDGQRAIVYGQANNDHTEVIAIDLAEGKIVNRLQLAAGAFSFVHFNGSDAWIVLSRSTLATSPTTGQIKDDSVLMHLRWTESGLVNQASIAVDNGLWSAADNRLIMASLATDALAPTTTVHLYDIGQGRLSELTALEFKNSFAKSIVISADGQRASVIRGADKTSFEHQTLFDLLNLRGTAIEIQETVTVDGWVQIHQHDIDRAVVFGQDTHKLLTVDLRSDAASTTRTQTWDLPQSVKTSEGYLPLSDGRFAIPAYVFEFGPFFSASEPSQAPMLDGTYLLVVNPRSSQVQITRLAGLSGRMISVEPDTDRIGIFGWSPDSGSSASVFTYGRIDETGNLVERNAIFGVDAYRDVAVVFSDRLLTAAEDQVAIYNLGQSGKPLLIDWASEPAPALKAINYEVQVPKQGMLFDPLPFPVDQVAHYARTRIIALEGAPAGVEITTPHTISFSAYDQSDLPSADFDYVVTDGVSETRGHIRVEFTQSDSPVRIVSQTDASPLVTRNQTVSAVTETTSGVVSLLKHNATAPLDVNSDGNVTDLDVLLVINALNSSIAEWSDYWLDINNDGLLQPIDVLLIVNQLNGPMLAQSRVAAEPPTSTEELFEIRTAVMKAELAGYQATGFAPYTYASMLVGFQPAESQQYPQPTSELTYDEYVDQLLGRLEAPTESWLTQAVIKDCVQGPASLAVSRDMSIRDASTGKLVNVIYIQNPRQYEDGTLHVMLTTNYGTPDGSLGIDFLIEKVDGHWQVATRTISWIS